MTGKAAEKLVNPDLYQVFLMTCPAFLPFSFASHPWFVVNRKGVVSRWAVGIRKFGAKREGYLNKGAFPPFQGLPLMFPFRKPVWPGRVWGYIEGGEGSIAARMAERIEHSRDYPFKARYNLFGPNSNTYAQWILDQFPEAGLKLPWNAIGKGYKK